MHKHIHLKYLKDPRYKYFNLDGSPSSTLPDSISIQETQERYRIDAPYVLMDRKARKFITGLKRHSWQWYYGDLRITSHEFSYPVKKDFLLVLIGKDAIEIFQFPGTYPSSPEIFIRSFLFEIKRPES